MPVAAEGNWAKVPGFLLSRLRLRLDEAERPCIDGRTTINIGSARSPTDDRAGAGRAKPGGQARFDKLSVPGILSAVRSTDVEGCQGTPVKRRPP